MDQLIRHYLGEELVLQHESLRRGFGVWFGTVYFFSEHSATTVPLAAEDVGESSLRDLGTVAVRTIMVQWYTIMRGATVLGPPGYIVQRPCARCSQRVLSHSSIADSSMQQIGAR